MLQACAAGADILVSSMLGRAEFYSTGHRKVRENYATSAQLAIVFQQFDHDCAVGAIQLLPVTAAMIDRAEKVYLSAPASTFLRGADALHLASAAEHGFNEIYSNDRHLLAAAPLFGIRGINVIP